MANEKPEVKPLIIIDPADAPDIFASWATGLSRRQGNLHISLLSDRFDHNEHRLRLVVIGRLVMPIEGVIDMVKNLQNFLLEIGVDPANPPAPSEPKPTLQ